MGSDFVEAVRRIYEENREGLFTYALSITGRSEDAEDAVQSAFFALLRRNSLPCDPRPYVYRCVRNAIIDNGRHRKVFNPAEGIRNQAVAEEGAPIMERALRQCLARVSREEREAIVLKIYGGLVFREISVITGDSVNTVASRYRRGLEKIRSMLEAAP